MVLVTKLSTIYYSGDSSKPRTAEPGFDIRIDLFHGLFGFCPTTVIAATDCGLVTTWTCSNAREPFCSYALLTLSNDVGPYTYIACGRTAVTDQYLAFTTSKEEPSSSAPRPTSSIAPSTSTDPQRAVSDTAAPSTATRDPQKRPTSTAASDTNAPPAPDPTSPSNNSNSNSSSSDSSSEGGSHNNTPAIIGGVFGCLVLVCACAILLFWMCSRSRTAAAAAAAATGVEQKNAPSEGVDVPPPAYKGAAEAGGREMPAELSGRGPSAYGQWGAYAGYPPMTPVEWPASTGGWNRLSRGRR
ncbi:hypothetical protein VTG60DRAFT_2367 [Thermothelomyces hinnuleus]